MRPSRFQRRGDNRRGSKPALGNVDVFVHVAGEDPPFAHASLVVSGNTTAGEGAGRGVGRPVRGVQDLHFRQETGDG